MAQPIPVANLYYLFLYAWNRLPEGRIVGVSGTESPDLPSLLCKVLIQGFHHLRRRGIDRQYIAYDEDLSRPRGRMRISDTLTRGLLAYVKVACTVDDLSRDVLHNQILKSTFVKLARMIGLEHDQKCEIQLIIDQLYDVRSIKISSRDFGLIQLHGNNAFYGFLLRVCALIHEALMPEPGSGGFRFRDIVMDPQTMGLVFQDFIRNFYRLEQRDFDVKGEKYPWPYDATHGQGHELMPTMNTDTSLLRDDKVIIVECKWTGTTLLRGRLSSDHLYQLSAYMRHHKRSYTSQKSVEGLLLYPLVDRPVDVAVCVNGQTLRARTVDLASDWRTVRQQLLEAIGNHGVQEPLLLV